VGGYSGAILGAAGAIIPCSQTYEGPYCVRAGAVLSGAVGVVSAVLIGVKDTEQINDRFAGAGIGFFAGGGAALALSTFIQRFEPRDALAVGLVGGAIGASPVGAAIGLGVGSAVGFVLWRTVPGFEMPDALGAALAGLALGGLTDWAISALHAERPAPAQVFSLTVAVP